MPAVGLFLLLLRGERLDNLVKIVAVSNDSTPAQVSTALGLDKGLHDRGHVIKVLVILVLDRPRDGIQLSLA